MSRRDIAALVLGSRITHGIWRPTLGRNRLLRILAYHRVLDDDPISFAFDEEVISASTESFYQQMKFVRSNFNVVSFQDLYDCEVNGKPWPDRALIITFDDGYRDNYTNAFPILKQMGLCATIFLVTGHIGSAKLFWWDLIAYCIKHTELSSVLLPEISSEALPLTNASQQQVAIRTILRWIKRVPEEVKNHFLEKLAPSLNVKVPNDIATGMHLSWDEVKKMAADGIDFGSHTVTHPVLSNVSRLQLKQEVCRSKETIEQQLGCQVIALAYPVGSRKNFNEHARSVVAECEFKYAVSYDEGIVSSTFDRYAMPRIHVERYHSLNIFRSNLMFPQLMLG
jgi:peptidoglycan/xylan/chitin deacetylase (PgdA/CDA1 family)